MIKVKDLSLSYTKNTVIDSASFHIKKGEFAVLVGDNGSGKSTLLSAVASVMPKRSGEISMSGSFIYVPQSCGLIEELTFIDNLRYFASLYNVKVPKELPLKADHLLKTKIRDMSGGMKKLCSIVCALIADADILLLDEPVASLDREHGIMLREYLSELKKQKKTILYIGHSTDEYSSLADLYLTLENKKISVRYTNKEHSSTQIKGGGNIE